MEVIEDCCWPLYYKEFFMDKRYQVFVSSTYEDLQEERREVMQALLELDCIPAGMELFPASNDDQWTLIKRVIDDCDYYILIIGGRYGSLNEKGISYTQMEFEYALQSGKPIISFIHKNPDSIPSGKTEKSEDGREKLHRFVQIVKRKMVRFWENPSDLGSQVSRSMIRLIKDYPSEGWIRANSAIDLEAAKEIARLQKENRALYKIVHDNDYLADEGIQVLAQGNDLYNIVFICDVDINNHMHNDFHLADQLSWDFLFQKIGGVMLEHNTESNIYDGFLKNIAPYVLSILQEKVDKSIVDNDLYEIELFPGVFRSIMIQFAALGLIHRIDSNENGAIRWELTEHGEKECYKVIAIKRTKNYKA